MVLHSAPALLLVLLSVDTGAVEVLMGLPEKIQTWSVPPGDCNLVVATKHTHGIVEQKWEVDLIRWLKVRCRQEELKALGLGRGRLVRNHSRDDGHCHALGTSGVSCREGWVLYVYYLPVGFCQSRIWICFLPTLERSVISRVPRLGCTWQ